MNHRETSTYRDETPQGAEHIRSGVHRIPRAWGRCLVTFEVSDCRLQWSATPASMRKRSSWTHQTVAIGYGEPDRLAAWFDEFWTMNGARRHELHLLVSGPDILQRSFFVPKVPQSELKAVVTSQARHVFPFDIRKGLFDFKQIDQLERAGAPVLEIHALALGGNWPTLLRRLLGERLRDVTLITSPGQKAEPWLSLVSGTFADEDSLLVKLRDNVLETAFYRFGEQEFFRETVIDSLPASGAAAPPPDSDRSASPATDQVNPRVYSDIRRIIRDALDYYLGQTPDRHVQTVYLCLPPAFDEEINLYVDTELNARAVSIASPTFIEQHLEQCGIHEIKSQYCTLASLLPPVGSIDSLLNLLPEDVVAERRLIRIRDIGRVSLTAITVALAVITGLQFLEYRQLDRVVQQEQARITALEQHPLIADLNTTTHRAGVLRGELAPYDRQSDPGMRYGLQVLSGLARDGIALDRIQLAAGPGGGCLLSANGKITDDRGRHESLLYAYLVELKSTQGIGQVDLISKNSTEQFGRKTVHFAFKAEVGI